MRCRAGQRTDALPLAASTARALRMPTVGTDARGLPRRSQARQAAGCLAECRARLRASASPSAATTATRRLRSAGTDTRGRSIRPPLLSAGAVSMGCRAGQQTDVRPLAPAAAMAEKRSGSVGTEARGRYRRRPARRTVFSARCRAGLGTDASPSARFREMEAASRSFGMEARGRFRTARRSATAWTCHAGLKADAPPSATPCPTTVTRPTRLRRVGALSNNGIGDPRPMLNTESLLRLSRVT